MNSVAVAYKKGFRNSLHFFDADDPKASVAKMRETVSKMSKEIKKAESDPSPEVKAWAKDQQKSLSEASKELALISSGDQPIGRLKRLKIKIAEDLAKTKEFYKKVKKSGNSAYFNLLAGTFAMIAFCVYSYGSLLSSIVDLTKTIIKRVIKARAEKASEASATEDAYLGGFKDSISFCDGLDFRSAREKIKEKLDQARNKLKKAASKANGKMKSWYERQDTILAKLTKKIWDRLTIRPRQLMAMKETYVKEMEQLKRTLSIIRDGLKKNAPSMLYLEIATLIGVPILILASIIKKILWNLELKSMKDPEDMFGFNELNKKMRNIQERSAQAAEEFSRRWEKL